MDSKQLNSDPFTFDGFDCPQRLENLDQAEVDDSWFFRKSIPENLKIAPKEQEKNEDPLERLSSISENDKENYSCILNGANCNTNGNETYDVDKPKCSSNPSESTAQQFAAPTNQVLTATSSRDVAGAAPPRLVTSNRCQQRSKWETLRLQRERHRDVLRQLRKDSICRHEQERVQQLRAAAVPKAQPIRHYKPMQIHRSEKPLTVAKSPDFALSRKDRHKALQDQLE